MPFDGTTEENPLDCETARWAMFPLHLTVRNADGVRCGCGEITCRNVGKHPAGRWGTLGAGEKIRGADGCGYGIATGEKSGVFVVDLDTAKHPDALEEWERLNGGDCPLTLTVRTGSGGWHFYFKWPGFKVRNTASELARGIDTRGDGGYVVAPGSPHKSGGTYEAPIFAEVADAPEWLIEWFRARAPSTVEALPAVDDVTEPAERARAIERFVEFCRSTPAAVEGERDSRLWSVVQVGAWDLRLPTEDVLTVVADYWNPRCAPPLDAHELARAVRHKSKDAKTQSRSARKDPSPVQPTTPAPAVEAKAETPPSPVIWGGWDQPVPPVDWLVEGLIPVSTVGGFVAHGSSLKTWTVLSMGAAVARGVPWLGRYRTKRGRVLVADYESGLTEMRRRVRLLEPQDVPDMGMWPFPDAPVNDASFWSVIGREHDRAPIMLLVVDSLAAGMADGIDENTAAAAGPLKLAAKFTEATGAAVLFIHHSKKDDGGDARKAVRGSTAIFAAMDWCYGFAPGDETPTAKRMLLQSVKPCMGAKPLPVPIELTDSGLRLYEEGAARTGQDGAGREVPAGARIMLALAERGPMGGYVEVAATTGLPEKVARHEIKLMLERGDLIRGAGRKLYPGDDDAQRARARAAVARAMANGRALRTTKDLMSAASVTKETVESLVAEGVIAWNIADPTVGDRQLFLVGGV